MNISGLSQSPSTPNSSASSGIPGPIRSTPYVLRQCSWIFCCSFNSSWGFSGCSLLQVQLATKTSRVLAAVRAALPKRKDHSQLPATLSKMPLAAICRSPQNAACRECRLSPKTLHVAKAARCN
jgi:hypothetical protein